MSQLEVEDLVDQMLNRHKPPCWAECNGVNSHAKKMGLYSKCFNIEHGADEDYRNKIPVLGKSKLLIAYNLKAVCHLRVVCVCMCGVLVCMCV